MLAFGATVHRQGDSADECVEGAGAAGLAGLLATVAETKANLIRVDHVRDAANLEVRETGIELTLETRGHDHAEAVRRALSEAGYEASEI